jgi:hypothetical protein
VLEVVLLQLLPVSWQRFVVEEIMCQIIADIPEYPATEDSGCDGPIPKEYGMRQFPEWHCEDKKEGWWHDQSELIHGKVVVDTMQEKMQCKRNTVFREKSGHRSQHRKPRRHTALTYQDETRTCAASILLWSTEIGRGASMLPLRIRSRSLP